jgi:hypothetical protein
LYKLTSSILLLLFSTFSLAEDTTPIYDNVYAAKTKEVMMLSQILPEGQELNIMATENFHGKRGFFSSMSKNDDPSWRGSATMIIDVRNCFSDENVQELAKSGIVFKSRIGDSAVVAYREAIKQFKKDGAKYIFVAKETDDHKNHTDIPFLEYFQKYLTEEYTLNDQLRGVSKKTGKINGFFQTMDSRCTQDNSFKASDILWGVGQLASLALGAKGANMGNANMTSLATNTSHAVDNTATLMANGEKGENPKKVSGIATRTYVSLEASTTKDQYAGEGYVFPIEDVEEHLAHYKVIPYETKDLL